MKRLFCSGTVFFWLLSLPAVSFGQVTTATVSGTVKDATGAVVPDATVVLLNEDTGIPRTVATDTAGRYSAPSLSLGRYRVTVSREGFQTEVRSGIELTLARNAVVDFELAVGAVAQTVEVTGEAPLVQTTDSTVGYLIEDRTIRDLPLNGRDLTQLIFLNPGVTAPPNYSRTRSFHGFGAKISISGSRGEGNAYLLDGSYLNDFNHGLPASPGGALLGVETVREFQVLTNSYGAQYGRVTGGVFSAVSKSGTNEWHGSVYEYLRNSALDARNFFDRKNRPGDPRLPSFRRNQFGSTFSGPMARDKSFFFLAYEGMREVLTVTTTATVPDANLRQGILPGGVNVGVSPQIAPYLAIYPSANGTIFGDGTGQYIFLDRQPTHEDFGQARFDHQFSQADAFFTRFAIIHSATSSASGLFPPPPIFGIINNLKTRLLTLSETHIFSSRALNTFRFSFNRVDPYDVGILGGSWAPELFSVPSSGTLPRINPSSGIAQMGPWQDIPSSRMITNRFNYQNDMNLTLGSHSLQFGGMIERLRFNYTFPIMPSGSWAFQNLTNFLRAIPLTYTGTPPELRNPTRGFRQTFFALYLQDDWKVTPRLTLNLGLRWEPYTTPSEADNLIANVRHITDPKPTTGAPYWLNQSWGDLGPRLGFAWSPFEGGKTSVRGGVGLSYLPNDSVIYRTPSVRNLPFTPEVQITNPQNFPNALAAIAAAQVVGSGLNGASQNINFDNLKSPHALQYNLNVQQQLGTSNVLTVGYVGNRGINLWSFYNMNFTPPFFNGVSLEVPANAARINPNFTELSFFTTGSNSWYNGLTLSLQRRFSHNLQTTVSYTFSRTISETDASGGSADLTGSGGGNALRNPYERKAGKGLSGYHQKNTLKLNYSYDLPLGRGLTGMAGRLLSGWQLTGIVSLQNGQPFSVVGGGSLPSPTSTLNYTRLPNADPTFQYDEIIQGGPQQYFNPLAFTLARPLELGNVGRNTLIGPGLAQWDAAITKNLSLKEQWGLQFRAEFFNLLNRANFGLPSASIFAGSGSRAGNAGQITSTVATARQIQFGLKLSF